MRSRDPRSPGRALEGRGAAPKWRHGAPLTPVRVWGYAEPRGSLRIAPYCSGSLSDLMRVAHSRSRHVVPSSGCTTAMVWPCPRTCSYGTGTTQHLVYRPARRNRTLSVGPACSTITSVRRTRPYRLLLSTCHLSAQLAAARARMFSRTPKATPEARRLLSLAFGIA